MANYQLLKADIDAKVYQNGAQEITGANLNAVLNAMVTTLGAEYQFAGVATIDTNPGTPDAKVFYIANGKGTYTNFGGLEVTEDEVVVLYWDTAWHKVSTGIASQEKLTELGTKIRLKDYIIEGELYDVNGTIQKSPNYKRLPLIKASDKVSIVDFNVELTTAGNGCRCFSIDKQYISDLITEPSPKKDYIYELPKGTEYIGFYFSSGIKLSDKAIVESPAGIMTELYTKANDGLLGKNILQDSSIWKGGYINNEGIIVSDDISKYKYVLLLVTTNDIYYYWYHGIKNNLNCFYDKNMNKLGELISMSDGLNKLIVPERASYLGLTIQFGENDSYSYKWLVRDNTPTAQIAQIAVESNLFKIYSIAEHIVKGSLWGENGEIQYADTFDRTDVIPATKGFYYQGCVINNVRCFNANKELISAEAVAEDRFLQYITLSEKTAYVGINFRVSAQQDAEYKNSYIVMNNNPLVSPIFEKPENVLGRKKWYFAGDSFSAGLGLSTFSDGVFKGMPKTYPYLIALRNGMIDIVNDAISGSAMTYQEGNALTNNAYSVSRYKNIPADVDYITLYFGINDSNYQSPVGTIDDADNTTFYGAWNVVMKYIITNHPLAKIGIIITNGASPEYTAAERAIAKKYGVSFLDLELDVKIPYFLRQAEKAAALNIPTDVVNLRTQTYALNPPYDTHPNEKAHEFESTFIESWLKSL